MARNVEKSPEELEQEFNSEIGMGDFLSSSVVWLFSLFDHGRTKLCLAVLFGRTEEVERTLFFHPELIDSIWDWGPYPRMTLLHCAVSALKNRELTLELLLKKGLNPKSADGNGLTAMEYVLQGPRDHRTHRLITILRDHGAF